MSDSFNPGSRPMIAPSSGPYLLQITIGIVGVSFCFFFMNEHRLAQMWPVTSGVLMPRIPRSNEISYQYFVKGRAYEVKQIHPLMATETAQTAKIAYDPEQPRHGIIKEDNMFMLFCGMALSAVLAFYSYMQYVGGSKIDIGYHSGARY